MNRIEGAKPGWIARLLFRQFRKRLGTVPKSKLLAAYRTPVLLASTWMDSINAAPRLVSATLKELAQLKVAMLAGCPF